MDRGSPRIHAGDTVHHEAELANFAHCFLTVDRLRLHYVVGGRDDAPTVLMLAGFPQSWFAWRYVIPRLSDGFRVIALDL